MKLKRFLKELKQIRKQGCDFALHSCPSSIFVSKKKYVRKHSLLHMSNSASLWCVVAMVHNWNQKKRRPWLLSYDAARQLGIAPSLFRQIQLAVWEREGYDEKLRKQLLKAAGVKETKHKDRFIYRAEKHKKRNKNARR